VQPKHDYLQHFNYNTMLESLINLFAPHNCLGCAREGALLCTECAEQLPVWPPTCYRCGGAAADWSVCRSCRRSTPLRHVYIATHYEGIAKDVVWRLKFAGGRAATTDMARLIVERLPLPSEVVLVHIPAASSRVRLRGYDQAALLARALSRMLRAPRLNCLVHLGQQRQVGASRQQRLAQAGHAFRLVRGANVEGKHVLLIDDVLTTGATLESAARLLKQAGAKQVDAVVFAHA
jgi:ComF family protein